MTNDVKVVFKRLDVERDNIIAQNLTMGQTEVAAIKANETSKVFNKYVKGAKITQSVYNFNFNRIHELVSKIIRGYSMIFDNITLYGDGLNNGILTTSDPNNVENESIEIDTTADIMGLANQVVDIISGLKQQVREYTASTDVLVYVYGGQLVRMLDKIVYNGATIREIIEKAWPEANFVVVPEIVLTGNSMGFKVFSQDLVTLNYTRLPIMSENGYNPEDKYFWGNFELGSTMVDIEEKGAGIEQPITIKSAAGTRSKSK
ncbi:hypothetical protein [Phascolarctobacterium faecium]|uniref:hypothetical protein n=1 Tax=Phascolarctobacterium faecium TaxID=33025 RepID=UPI00242DC3D4|nr:hypothetical protein [Phascolarctobacterium faecium]